MGNPRFTPPFTYNQLKALIIIPRFSTIPSFIGLCWIFYHVLKSKDRRSRSYHRFVLVMSINDIITTFVLWLSTWPVPKDYPTFGAKGTAATCEATAFLRESATRSSVMYSACLAIYFLLVIKYRWRETRLRKAELAMHIINNGVGWGLGVSGFPLTLYNPYFLACSIQRL